MSCTTADYDGFVQSDIRTRLEFTMIFLPDFGK